MWCVNSVEPIYTQRKLPHSIQYSLSLWWFVGECRMQFTMHRWCTSARANSSPERSEFQLHIHTTDRKYDYFIIYAWFAWIAQRRHTVVVYAIVWQTMCTADAMRTPWSRPATVSVQNIRKMYIQIISLWIYYQCKMFTHYSNNSNLLFSNGTECETKCNGQNERHCWRANALHCFARATHSMLLD